MLRKEIEKYVKETSDLREKIKNEQNEEKRQELIKELADVYSKLEFFRGIQNAKYKIEKESVKDTIVEVLK